MKKAGRHLDRALMGAVVNEKMQTFSQRRLIKDLAEIDNEKIPTVGVTARPLQTDMFTWHANIRGPQKTSYQGGVFHLQLKFPQSYPNHPPSIRLFTPIPHPNVFGGYICLDMLQQLEQRYEEGSGWSSAYSVQSVLTQLQSFLFQEFMTYDKASKIVEIKKAVAEANVYKCASCKHGGKLSLWPPFNKLEHVLKEFQILEGQNEIIRHELICFHTKVPFQTNQLGLGLKISKIPRTGLIKEGEVYFDYLSIKAFIKESINKTSNNEKFTHWMPVFFGETDNYERFYHFFKKSLSMIMTNSTKNFRADFILEVLPKLFITLAFHIMDEKKHPSIRIIRVLTHIHSIFLYAIREHPELADRIATTLNTFIKDDAYRHKNTIPNLGCVLAMLSVADSHKFKDVAEAYFAESLDRQVFWILKAVPQLLLPGVEDQADKLRTQLAFKTQMTSFHIFCFYKLFITQICEKRNSKAAMLNQYDANLCKLTNKEENFFQEQIKRISKTVLTFNDFFNYVGLKNREQPELVKLLKEAIKNSERKEYHTPRNVAEWEKELKLEGKKSSVKVELAPKISSEEQFKKFSQNIPSYHKFIKVTHLKKQPTKEGGKETTKEGDKETQFSYQEVISSENDWRELCINRWSWIKEAMLADPTLSSNQISEKALQHTKKGVSKNQDRITKIINEEYKNSHIKHDEPKVNIPESDWKRLFLRLDLQDFLKYIDMNPDFPTLYEKVYVCAQNNLNTLLIPILDIQKLKSGYYYITALLSKISTLKYLEFSGLPQINNSLNDKAAKAIKKGLNNFFQAKGRLDILSFNQLIVNVDYSQYLFGYLNLTDSLVSLRFSKTNLLSFGNAMKVLSNILISLKELRELSFVKCSLDQQKCKILADSLMRMKRLQIFKLNHQKGLGQGVASIVYNLSFSPNLRFLDLGDINTQRSNSSPQIAETVISLYKMLRISSSIQILKLNNFTALNPALNRQFWSSLGDSKSIKVLDLSRSGDLSAVVRDVGGAIAFNAKRKGVLAYVNLTGTINNNPAVNNLYEGMNVSEYEEEQWYGDPNKVLKMISGNYKREFFNNLRALQLQTCNSLNPTFTLSHYNKLVNKVEPELVKLLADSPNLTTLHLKDTKLQKNIADVLVLALDNRRVGLKCQLKVLDLSKNNLQKEGVKLLAEVLPFNQVLEVLDLSKNNMGVSGADELAKSLRANKSLRFLNVFNNKISYDGAKSIAENIVANHPTLQFLEVGHNRIRDKGFSAIIEALVSNTSSNIKVLGTRFNFLTNTGVLQNFQKITSAKTKLDEIFITNNLVNDEGIYKLKEVVQASNSQISIDLLERVKYLDQERLDRTVWIHPINQINLAGLKTFFEITHKCGIILDFRVRNGRQYPNKTGENKFCFVEFADSASANEALSLAAQQLTEIGGKKFRVFKAGTGTFIYSKKTAKEKKLEQAKGYLPYLPFPAPPVNPIIAVPTMGMPGMVPPPVIQQRMPRPRQDRPARPRGGPRGGNRR